MGLPWSGVPDLAVFERRHGERWLLATAGLWRAAGGQEIRDVLISAESAQTAAGDAYEAWANMYKALYEAPPSSPPLRLE